MQNTNLLISLLDHYSYYTIFLVIFIAEIGIPLPIPASSELLFFYAGYLIYLHKITLWYAILAGAAGDFAGSMLLFLLFFYLGEFGLIKKLEKKLFEHENAGKIKNALKKNSIFLVLLARLTPFIRVYTSPLAGIIELDPFKFSILSLTGSLVWVTTLILLGLQFAPEFQKVQQKLTSLHNISSILAIVIGGVILIYIGYLFWKNFKRSSKKN